MALPVSYTKGNNMDDDDEQDTSAVTDDTSENDSEDDASEAIDVSVYEAKIAALEAAILEKEGLINDLTSQIQAIKAANYDLLINGSSGLTGDDYVTPLDAADSDDEGPDISDFFTTKDDD